ncbi:ATP-binding protein [Pyxidicoccus sp. 3LFB2]
MAGMQLVEMTHPSAQAQEGFDALIGLENQKQLLLEELLLLLAPDRLSKWLKRHHAKGLPLAASAQRTTPLVLLSGEVGCGKTALATSVGTPLARELGETVRVLETPSDIRGTGLVGELSTRVTEAFAQARSKVGKGYGLLIIDEADDIGMSRSEQQAHHEDRAGLNVLIKQLDTLPREKVRMAVLMITNRVNALDPAVRRRAALTLEFSRPGQLECQRLFEHLLRGSNHTSTDVETLVHQSKRKVPYSYSDLMHRVARAALLECLRRDEPFGPAGLMAALARVEPSPMMAP